MRNQRRAPPEKQRIRYRRGDKVMVINGDDKGMGPAEVLRVMHDTGKLLVQGVNVQKKHMRKTQENPKGGVRETEGPIDASNVLLYSEKEKKGVRVRFEVRDGKKVRVGTCGTVFDGQPAKAKGRKKAKKAKKAKAEKTETAENEDES